jgi:crossover junction endodeoxyribonuclease RusA
MISLWIDGEPPKATSQQKGIYIRAGKPFFFTKGKVQAAKMYYVRHMLQHAPKNPLETPQSVEVLFSFPYTADDKRKKTIGYVPHSKRPDLDNLVKLLMDAMTTSKWIVDDSIVTRLCVTKVRSAKAGIGIHVAPHHK